MEAERNQQNPSEAPTGEVLLSTDCGPLLGLDNGRCREFRGVPFARAERFAYAQPVTRWDGVLDARRFGPGCPQNRAVHEHPEHPTRRFYKREYREGLELRYDEDCLNLNIYAPYRAEKAPVILFFFGGGFDSGLNCEGAFDGSALAEQGVVTVFANYRVGVLGYLTHAEMKARYGREGNLGLDDQLTALRWLRDHVSDFGGDPENITLMGQSAGAISVQYLCLNPANKGLFRRAIMLSGAGKFPKFALPRPAEQTRAYWAEFMAAAGCRSFDELSRRAALPALRRRGALSGDPEGQHLQHHAGDRRPVDPGAGGAPGPQPPAPGLSHRLYQRGHVRPRHGLDRQPLWPKDRGLDLSL